MVLLDILEGPIREVELCIDVAGVGIVWARADWGLLLLLPFEDALALGRVVALLLDLLHERPGLPRPSS